MSESSGPRVVYLCLELLQPGQAASTHVHAIAGGMGLPTTLIALAAPATGGRPAIWRRLLQYIRLTSQAIRALRNSDALYLRAHPAAIVATLVAGWLGRPVFHEVNGLTDDISLTHRLPGWITRILHTMQIAQYRRATALIAVTPGLVNRLRDALHPQLQIKLVPNGADAETFTPHADGGPTIAADYVLFFGGLVAWHGVGTMLKARSELAWPAGVKLVIAGQGPHRGAVTRAAAENPDIVDIGYLPKSDLAGLAARSLATLCPIETHADRHEGVAPLKLFEGMAAGRPVVASDLPFQRDIIIDHRCGLIFEPGDASGLARAVARIAEDRVAAEAMGQRGRQAVESLYDWRYRALETAALIRACTNSNAPVTASL